MISAGLLLALVFAVYPRSIRTAPFLEQRSDDLCQSGIYGDLVPLLIDFEPAQIFCTDLYPVKCTAKAVKRVAATASTTSKVSRTSTTTQVTTSCTNGDKVTSSSKTTAKVSTTTSKTTTSAVDAKSSAWSQCQQQPWNVISTLCSCIQQPKPCTVTTSKVSSTTTKQTTSTTCTPSTTTSGQTTTSHSTTISTSRSTSNPTTARTTSATTTTSSTMSTTSSATKSSSTTSSTASSTISSATSTTTTSSSLITSTTTSSTTTIPDAVPITDCTQLAPASTGVYVAPNADNFYLECGKYYQEDDTDAYANSLNGDGGNTNVDGFKGCLDLCSTTAGCNYISFYEQTSLCHLLSGLYNGPNAASGGTYAGYDRASLQTTT